jgi:hypothetical protein
MLNEPGILLRDIGKEDVERRYLLSPAAARRTRSSRQRHISGSCKLRGITD